MSYSGHLNGLRLLHHLVHSPPAERDEFHRTGLSNGQVASGLNFLSEHNLLAGKGYAPMMDLGGLIRAFCSGRTSVVVGSNDGPTYDAFPIIFKELGIPVVLLDRQADFITKATWMNAKGERFEMPMMYGPDFGGGSGDLVRQLREYSEHGRVKGIYSGVLADAFHLPFKKGKPGQKRGEVHNIFDVGAWPYVLSTHPSMGGKNARGRLVADPADRASNEALKELVRGYLRAVPRGGNVFLLAYGHHERSKLEAVLGELGGEIECLHLGPAARHDPKGKVVDVLTKLGQPAETFVVRRRTAR